MKVSDEVSLRLLGYPEFMGLPEGFALPAKGFQLLAMLTLAPMHRASRQEIATLLWENATDEMAFANLRQLLVRLRKMLPDFDQFIMMEGRYLKLGLNAGKIDVVHLNNIATSTQQPQSYISSFISLFRGELLSGVTDCGSAFQHWLMQERASLAELYFENTTSALIEMTRYGRADPVMISKIAQHMLHFDHTREATYRTLIEVFGRIGKMDEAERHYQAMLRVLKSELDTTPSPDTQAVVRRVFASGLGTKQGASELPQASSSLPRVAFLAPIWLVSGAHGDGVLRALVEDVANELARYHSFSTLAAHSGFQVQHDGGIILGDDALRADYTVSGFVKPGEGYGDLALRMVNCSSASIIWAGEFALQQDLLSKSFRVLTTRIAATLASELERDYRQELSRTQSNHAYLHFLNAQQFLKNCDLRAVRRARNAFSAAIDEDRKFAAAHAGLAQSLYLEWLLLGGTDPQLLNGANSCVENAINFDPNAAAGHWRKAMVNLYRRDFDGSERCFQEARILSPNSADMLLDYSDALGFIGDASVAWSLFERAIDLNPLPPDHYWWAGASVAFSQGQYLKAIELCGRLANDESVLRLLAASHGLVGNKSEARSYGRRLIETYPGETAREMVKLQPHRSEDDLQTFIEGLRIAGVP